MLMRRVSVGLYFSLGGNFLFFICNVRQNTYVCRMNDGKQLRKEVHLSGEILEVLASLATEDERSLKQYMERVLNAHAFQNQRKVTASTGREISIKTPMATAPFHRKTK